METKDDISQFKLHICFKDYVDPCKFCKNAEENGGKCNFGDEEACTGYKAFLNYMEKYKAKKKKKKM